MCFKINSIKIIILLLILLSAFCNQIFCSYIDNNQIVNYKIDLKDFVQISYYDSLNFKFTHFYINKSEVNQELWIEEMGYNNSFLKNDSLPVDNISWKESILFCNKLSKKEQFIPYYSIVEDSLHFFVTINTNSDGYRLPYLHELKLSLGNQIGRSDSLLWDDYSWKFKNSNYGINITKQLKYNNLGMYDLVGNVYEWCCDNSDDLQFSKIKVGGSWKDPTNKILGSIISIKDLHYSDNETGIRLVRNIPPFGSIQIKCNETNYNIKIIDNKNTIITQFVSQSFLCPLNLACGDYKIFINKTGFREFCKKIKIETSQLIIIDVSLVKGSNPGDEYVFVDGGNYLSIHNNKEYPVSDLYISKYEVSQKEWKSIMMNNPSFFKGDSLPVESISFVDAITFCNKKSKIEGLEECYTISSNSIFFNISKYGYRLPTEIEWEFCASGGNNKNNFIYSGSDDINEVAWYINNSNNSTQKIGKKKPNTLGLYDMSGNVWEMIWCYDLFYSDDEQIKNNIKDIEEIYSSDSMPIVSIKGGSWFFFSDFCKIKETGSTSDKSFKLGLRILLPNKEYDNQKYGIISLNNKDNNIVMSLIDEKNQEYPINFYNSTILIPEGRYIFFARKNNYKSIKKDIKIYHNKKNNIILNLEKGVDTPKDFVGITAGYYKKEDTIVNISGFYISKNQVSQKEWSEIMNNYLLDEKNKDLPITDITWYSIIEFCNKKSISENLSPCYTINGLQVECNWDANGYRLPTVAEWEFSVYSSVDKNIYDESRNIVTIFDKNKEFYDYCWDKEKMGYDSETKKDIEVTNPRGDIHGSHRMTCGNSLDKPIFSSRIGQLPNIKGFLDAGFRLVRKIPTE